MNDFEHLPEDLQDIARALAAHRDVPDGHLLERVLARVKAAPRPRRGFTGFFKARLAALSMLGLILGLNVTGALASVLQACGVSSGTANSLNLSNLVTSLTQTVSTGSNWQSAADEVYCEENGKSGSENNNSGGSEQNSSPMTTMTKSTPMTSKVKGVTTTTWTQTTTTTTQMSSDQNGSGGSENNNGQCGCQTSAGSGSEVNGGSEKVDTKVDSYSNSKIVSTTSNTTYKNGDGSGSENNGSGSCTPPPEKPGCGNEQQAGQSGASGVHGGQPPMLEERGSCPQQTGIEGPPGYNG